MAGRKKNLSTGYAGTGILFFVVLTGALLIGFMFAGSGLPSNSASPTSTEVVTIIPGQQTGEQSNMQLHQFGGVTGIPTITPSKSPTPTL